MVYSSFFKHANAANKTNKIYNTVQLIIQEFNIIFSASCSCFYKLYFMDIDFDIDYYNEELDSTRLDIKKKKNNERQAKFRQRKSNTNQ